MLWIVKLVIYVIQAGGSGIVGELNNAAPISDDVVNQSINVPYNSNAWYEAMPQVRDALKNL